MIDNFEEIKKHLTFVDEYDRYVVNILRRVKDVDKNILGSNEAQRLLRTYYISDLEYLERKIPAIKELCITNNARAYILPQVRNNRDCLLNLGKIVLENLDNPTIKLDGICRKAVCSLHKSRDKKYIIDLDNDNMTEYKEDGSTKTWTVDSVLELIQKNLEKIGKNKEDAYVIPTKNGYHIVTSPFNVMEAHKKCNMIFEHEQKIHTGEKMIGPDESLPVYKKVNGWLIKDGMTLLFAP